MMTQPASETRTIEYQVGDDTRELVLHPALRGRSILQDTDLSPDELLAIIDTASMLKELRDGHILHEWLPGKTLGMIFQHPSTRTRTAFQAGMEQLGGRAIFLGIHDLQLRRGETIEDTAAIFSRYVDGVAARIASQDDLEQFASGATVPVFNGLTSKRHPIEALSDVMTLKQHFGSLDGLTFAYLGDGNNVCHSLMLTMAAAGVNITVACPDGYGPDADVVAQAQEIAAGTGATVHLERDPVAAVTGADAVYTDAHENMGEQENPGKLMALAPYRVTESLMARAKPEAVFMHCLPLRRGQEVESAVADGPQSIIFDQAECRLHVHKAVLLQVLHDGRFSRQVLE